MDIDTDKVDDAVLALLWLTLHDGFRAWKGFDWSALDRLHDKGLISNPASKAKSVVFSDDGLKRAEELFRATFARTFAIDITIVRWVDDEPQPGIVECQLADRFGKVWRFIEKCAVVSSEHLSGQSKYPQSGVIACQVIKRGRDKSGRETAEIDTEFPWHVETADGTMRFAVFADQLTPLAGR
jgi:hypothetical protein